MIAHSFLHGGPAVYGISPAVIEYWFSDSVDAITIEDIPDLNYDKSLLRLAGMVFILEFMQWSKYKRQHSLTSVERPSYLRPDFVNVWRHPRLVVYIYLRLMYAFTSIVHSDLSDDLTVCFEVLSCFFDHPSIDSTKKKLLHPFGKDVFMFRLDQAS